MRVTDPQPPGHELDDDPGRVDLDVVWDFLSTEAYWGRWRSREDVARQVRGAWRVVGASTGSGLVGLPRAISDGVGFAYLADVFVLPGHRGRGLGRRLVATMIDEGPGAGFRWLLHTADAHGLYGRFGFAAPESRRTPSFSSPRRPGASLGTGPSQRVVRGVAGCEPAVTRSATAWRASPAVTRPSPTSTASAPAAA